MSRHPIPRCNSEGISNKSQREKARTCLAKWCKLGLHSGSCMQDTKLRITSTPNSLLIRPYRRLQAFLTSSEAALLRLGSEKAWEKTQQQPEFAMQQEQTQSVEQFVAACSAFMSDLTTALNNTRQDAVQFAYEKSLTTPYLGSVVYQYTQKAQEQQGLRCPAAVSRAVASVQEHTAGIRAMVSRHPSALPRPCNLHRPRNFQ